jgi:hypothetical protein
VERTGAQNPFTVVGGTHDYMASPCFVDLNGSLHAERPNPDPHPNPHPHPAHPNLLVRPVMFGLIGEMYVIAIEMCIWEVP